MNKTLLFRTAWILGPLAVWTITSSMEGEPPGWGDPVAWNRTYGGAGYDVPHPVLQTSDGGYIVGGGSGSFGPGTYDAWIVKLDPLGNELWSRAYGGEEYDEIRSMQQTSDGGYILAGITYSFGVGGGDIWLFRIDENGNELWSRTVGHYLFEIAHAVEETSDGGFLVSGQINSFDAGPGNAFLLKTDGDGNEEWSQWYGGPERETAFCARQTSDGGVIVAGETNSFGQGGSDILLLKTDREGGEEWSTTFGGTAEDGAHCVRQTADGGFILAGGTEAPGQGSFDGWLIKTDAGGVSQWDRTFGGSDSDILFYVEQAADGGYIASGGTYSSGTGAGDCWLVRTDENGNVLWEKTFGGPDLDESYWFDKTDDGGFILSGVTESFGAGEGDFWIIKTDAEGNAPGVPSP